ncbi:MAG: pantoate--beta-alanine ligase [Bacteroidota bacterium]
MLVFRKVTDLQLFLQRQMAKGRQVGFIPTMGALHQGHLSLIRQAQTQSELTVCSIFVNPTQFNDPDDLKKYPRPVEQDIQLLTDVGCNLLFLPSVKEVYPKGGQPGPKVKLGKLAKVMEGKFRTGHFEGVVQVVHRLLEIVRPHRIFMGQKDFQQFRIIGSMLEQLKSSVQLVVCPILREEDGLAMSSRNRRLTPEHRKRATIVSQTLRKASELLGHKPLPEIQQWALQELATAKGFRPEYFEIVDGYSLQSLESFHKKDLVVACTAVWAGDIRLIDNMIWQNEDFLYPKKGSQNIS